MGPTAAKASVPSARHAIFHRRSLRFKRLTRQVLLLLGLAGSVLAQRPIDIRGTIGAAGFVDDSGSHRTFGASARFYITRRFAIEPEIQYLALNRNHHDWIFLPNASFDFRSIDKRVIPYVIGGVGYLRISDGIARRFSIGTWVAEGGGGAKIYVNRNVFIAPEVRIGSELYVRASASVGYTFGR
jgi:hypothetical protein